LFSLAAVYDFTLVDPAHQQRGRQAGDVLLPPVGARPRSAACAGTGGEVALSSLPQSQTHRTEDAPPACRFLLGSRGSGVPGCHRMIQAEAIETVPDSPATGGVAVRALAGADNERWDAFVHRCDGASFFHRIGWKQIIEDVFHHRTHYRVAERKGEIAGILPLAEIRSRLFGHSLVSLPFGVYGGPVAIDAEAEEALIDAAASLARTLQVDHLELRNRSDRKST